MIRFANPKITNYVSKFDFFEPSARIRVSHTKIKLANVNINFTFYAFIRSQIKKVGCFQFWINPSEEKFIKDVGKRELKKINT